MPSSFVNAIDIMESVASSEIEGTKRLQNEGELSWNLDSDLRDKTDTELVKLPDTESAMASKLVRSDDPDTSSTSKSNFGTTDGKTLGKRS